MFTSNDEVEKSVHKLFKFGDFNVYDSPLSNNIRLSHRITPTDIIANAMISYLLNYISETMLEM